MILITGASRGIGKYLFEKFQESNEIVLGTYNLTYPGKDKIRFFTKVDISDYSAVSNWIEEIKSKITKLTLINCAGNNYNSFAHKANIDKWSQVINVNLVGTFNVIRSVLPIMREQEYGRIINFSSIVAQKGIPGTSAYAASKAALWGMTKSVAAENARKGITINNLNLGYFNIGMITEVPEEILTGITKTIPSQKLGVPENIFNAVNFLINSDYANGTSININGALF